jgi:hypothetical protein
MGKIFKYVSSMYIFRSFEYTLGFEGINILSWNGTKN